METETRTQKFLKIKNDTILFLEYMDLYREWEDDTIFHQNFQDISDVSHEDDGSFSLDSVFTICNKSTYKYENGHITDKIDDDEDDEDDGINIDIGIITYCYNSWDNGKYKEFLENIEKNIPCKFSFDNSETPVDKWYDGFGGLGVEDEGICLATWIYMDNYIYFTTYDCGIVYNYHKVKVTDIIFDRLKKIHECWSDLKNHKG
jgi:hypothetical protein